MLMRSIIILILIWGVLMDIILQGGWVLWLLTLLSVYSLASIAWLALNAAKVVVKQPARGEGP